MFDIHNKSIAICKELDKNNASILAYLDLLPQAIIDKINDKNEFGKVAIDDGTWFFQVKFFGDVSLKYVTGKKRIDFNFFDYSLEGIYDEDEILNIQLFNGNNPIKEIKYTLCIHNLEKTLIVREYTKKKIDIQRYPFA